MKQTLVLIFLGILVLAACRKRDIADPSYMHIAQVEQNSKPGQGTSIHDIEYVYTLINDNSIGTYLTPTTVPVLYQGAYTVEARPMIKWLARDGFHPYSMLSNYAQQMNFDVLTVDTLRPVFEYQSNVEFKWMEDLNDNDASLEVLSGTFDTFYVKNDSLSLDGTPYMEIEMGNGEQFFEIQSRDIFELPMDGREVILEIDYNTNVAFTIGVFASNSSFVESLPSVTPYPTDGKWQKGYVYLTDELFNRSPDTKFRIYFRSANATVQDPVIRIDNIKLLYRKG